MRYLIIKRSELCGCSFDAPLPIGSNNTEYTLRLRLTLREILLRKTSDTLVPLYKIPNPPL